MTMSVGVAVVEPDDDGPSAIRRAAVAFYEATRLGRNRIVVA